MAVKSKASNEFVWPGFRFFNELQGARRAGILKASLICPLIIIVVASVMFLTAPRDEDFWWTDGASFALNGELVRDYLTSGFGQNPMTFASEWFLRYPALTFSLYPPIFPLAEAISFATFGFSNDAAQATVILFAILCAYGLYQILRTAAGVIPATAAAILLFTTPLVLLWSRQIVMEVPALSFLALAGAALLRYQAAQRAKHLFAAVLLTIAAIYTKQPAAFVAPAFAVALLADGGISLLYRKSVWLAFAVGVIGLVPITVFTIYYAPENFHIAFGTGTGDREYARVSVQALLAYGRVLPETIGLVPLAGAAAWLGVAGVTGCSVVERRITVLMLAWFVIDYLLISVTADFETRYATFLTVPPVVLSVLLIARSIHTRGGQSVALGLVVALFVAMIVTHPVRRLVGYGAVADYVINHSKQDDVVLFHGNDSKNFSFSVRARTPAAKVFILRAEKFLVDYNIIRDWGITDRNLSAAEIESLIDRKGVSMVVLQPDFWTDQPSIATLQELVYSGRFEQVAEFPITTEAGRLKTTMRVYLDKRPTQMASLPIYQ